jgi:four helix bundle protein
MKGKNRFSHHKLDCYRVALEMLRDVHRVTTRIPRGYRSFADQLLRAAGETVALIGEGANRFTKGQKRQRFTEARGEAGEVAVHVEAIRAMELICEHDANRLLGKADRVCAMLTRLIQIHS